MLEQYLPRDVNTRNPIDSASADNGRSGQQSTALSNEIDAGIRPLVEAMNATGCMKTISSCEGHPRKYYPPYVQFECSPAMAARLEERLRTYRHGNHPRLNADWTVSGHFDENCRLTFVLDVPGYYGVTTTLYGSLKQFLFLRAEVRRDIQTLKLAIQELFECEADERRNQSKKEKSHD